MAVSSFGDIGGRHRIFYSLQSCTQPRRSGLQLIEERDMEPDDIPAWIEDLVEEQLDD
jgi:hypothetical protein